MRLLAAALAASLLPAACGPAPEPQATLRRLKREGRGKLSAELATRLFKAREEVKARGGAGVVMGRVVVADGQADPRVVRAQMEILPDGWFAGPVKDFLRPLSFRLHGYAPLDVALRPPAQGDLLDLGEVRLEPVLEERRAALKGALVSAGGGVPPGAAAFLDLQIGPINTPSGGYEPRPPENYPPRLEVPVGAAGAFALARLSPAGYDLRVTAPGYVTRTLPLAFAEGKTLDAGTVTLEKERVLKLSYLVSPKPPFTGAPAAEEVAAGTHWRVPGPHWEEPERKWGKGYGFTLQIKQEGGRFLIWSFYFPCRIADLGPGRLEDFRNPDLGKVRFGGTQDRPVLPGHVYLFDHETFGYWVLFRADGA